jgi:hypothetical protein
VFTTRTGRLVTIPITIVMSRWLRTVLERRSRPA